MKIKLAILYNKENKRSNAKLQTSVKIPNYQYTSTNNINEKKTYSFNNMPLIFLDNNYYFYQSCKENQKI